MGHPAFVAGSQANADQMFYFEWFMVGAAGFEPATSTV
jgi:hypothetical protein